MEPGAMWARWVPACRSISSSRCRHSSDRQAGGDAHRPVLNYSAGCEIVIDTFSSGARRLSPPSAPAGGGYRVGTLSGPSCAVRGETIASHLITWREPCVDHRWRLDFCSREPAHKVGICVNKGILTLESLSTSPLGSATRGRLSGSIRQNSQDASI
jgi:hypothetical protein